MATTIHSLAYKVTADSRGFTSGIRATRKELREAKRVMKETQTPIEKYHQGVRQMSTLLRKGAIDQETYNRKVGKLRSAIKSSAPERASFIKSLNSMKLSISSVSSVAGPAGLAVGAFLGTFSSTAISAARGVLDKITANLEKIDRIGKVGAKLNIEPQALRSLQFAAGALSGIGAEQVSTALQRMTRRVSEAAAGTGEAKNALMELGLEAATLNQLSPDEQFKRIAGAIQSVEAPADRLRLAFKLFDTEGAGLVTTLGAGRGAIEELQSTFDTFAGKLSKLDVSRIETLNDELAKTQLAADGAFEQLTAEISIPALAVVKELNERIAQLQGQDKPRRGAVGTALASIGQFAGGTGARVSAQSAPALPGSVGLIGVVNSILSQIPSITSLISKHHTDDLNANAANTATIVTGLARVEEAIIENANGGIEVPPGSR